MPTPSLAVVTFTAGFIALVLLWPRVRSGPDAGRLAGEIVAATVAVSALIYVLLSAAQRLPW